MSHRHRRSQVQPPAAAASASYRIQVQGCVDPRWSDWFSGLVVAQQQDTGGVPETVLTGPVPDQAALRGILNKLWDLNLILVSVERVSLPVESEPTHEHSTGL
jgi:hypothetical protein